MAQTVEEARAALNAAEAKLASAGTTRERIAASKEAAEARKELQQANAEARATASAARAQAEADARAKAEAERPKTSAEMAQSLMGIAPEGVAGTGAQANGFPGYAQYKPIDDPAVQAAFMGYNFNTGKIVTPEEQLAAQGGYNPYAGAVGYMVDPNTGNLRILLANGGVMITGARYETTSAGYIRPQLQDDWTGFRYNEQGIPVNAQGQPITPEDVRTYNDLVGRDPDAAREFARGKGMTGNAINAGVPISNNPQGLGSTINLPYTGGASTVNLPYAGGASTINLPYTGGTNVQNIATGNVSTGRNPYQPGTTQYDKFEERRSAFDILYNEFDSMGLGSLVKPLERLIMQNVGDQQFAIELRASDEYKARFYANEERQKKGLRVLSPREYLAVEDSYRQVLRSYGLRQFDNDQYVQQFIANDISSAELSDRVSMAVQRVQNADPAISRTLRDYYGISNTDLVGYVLDPNQQLQKIQRQIAAAEIGTAARVQGLEPGVGVSEQLAAQGITQAQAQRGYATIADVLPTAEKLSQIYGATMEGYDLAQAEQEVFNQLASAQRRRERLSQREVAQFSGQSGLGRTSLVEESRGQF